MLFVNCYFDKSLESPMRPTPRHTCEGLPRLKLSSENVFERCFQIMLIDVGRHTLIIGGTIAWAGDPV